MKFRYLILRKISNFVAARFQILRLKCTKYNSGCGFTPDPDGGAYSARPDCQLDLRGLLLRERRGMEGERREREGTPKGWLTSPYVRNPEKYPASQ